MDLGGNYTSSSMGRKSLLRQAKRRMVSLPLAWAPLATDGTLSQTLQTTAGQQYTLSFWLANQGLKPLTILPSNGMAQLLWR